MKAFSTGLAMLAFAADGSAQQARSPRGPVTPSPSPAPPPAAKPPTPPKQASSGKAKLCADAAAELGLKGRGLELYAIHCRFPDGRKPAKREKS